MYMKNIGLFVFLMALSIGLVVTSLVSFGRPSAQVFSSDLGLSKVRGSGDLAKEARKVAGFTGIDVSNVFQVEYMPQNDFSVEVEADENLLPLIRTDVKGDTLHISLKKSVSTDNPLRVRIGAPALASIDISGAASVIAADVKNDSLSIDASGASKVSVKGEVSRLTIDVSGAAKIDAEDLRTQKAKVEASGASIVGVNVTGDLDAETSGASKVVYAGSPTNVRKRSSHGSSVVSRQVQVSTARVLTPTRHPFGSRPTM
jgi:hypothetical protein